MLTKVEFSDAITNLYRRMGRTIPSPSAFAQILEVLYHDCPAWMAVDQFNGACDRIASEEDRLPDNVMRAIRSRCFHRSGDEQLSGGQYDAVESQRNLNRVRALQWLAQQGPGHPLRDKLVALEGAALYRADKNLLRDSWHANRYRPLVTLMEAAWSLTAEERHLQTMQVLDAAIADMHGKRYLDTLAMPSHAQATVREVGA